MTDLVCCENGDIEITACVDHVLLKDVVLKTMLKTEEKNGDFYSVQIQQVQLEVTLEMTLIVSEWMMEVCEEQKCQDEVFLLAMNYFYRFLRIVSIKKNQLQLLGAACMLLASKLREPRPLSAETLVYYTDHSITKDFLTKFELLVLSKLKWDIVVIVPVDFLPHLLMRLNLDSIGVGCEMVKNHAKILITLCAKEFSFSKHHPSLIASACIVSALCGLGWVNKYHQTLDDLLQSLQELIKADKDMILELARVIDKMVKENFEGVNNSDENREVMRPEEFTPPPGKVYDHTTATTPTDVHDVNF